MAVKRSKVKTGSEPGASARQVEKLLSWYDKNRRVMPWRALKGQTIDPYRVWLSEIMLQQTTVATVSPYFQRFIKRWPTLDLLAQASLEDVLRLWAGLGYYRRARMLHQCASVLSTEHKGIFPRDIKTLLDLPGFGPYTAAAVAAIAFDQPANVVDGNVERVISRVFAIQTPLPQAKKIIRARAALLVPFKRCGDYAQALMDLGAMICTPRSPKCNDCPWNGSCEAKTLNIQELLPRRAKADVKPVRRARAFVVLNKKNEVFMRVRPNHGLLAEMLEVPSTAWEEGPMPEATDMLPMFPKSFTWVSVSPHVTHVFSHFVFEVSVSVAHVSQAAAAKMVRAKEGHWVALEALGTERVPSLTKKIISFALKIG